MKRFKKPKVRLKSWYGKDKFRFPQKTITATPCCYPTLQQKVDCHLVYPNLELKL